jgi:3-deoxy-D-manno-octulosonic-acid transferase
MARLLVLLVYNLCVPWFFLAALPGWLVKMARRGGWGRAMTERLGIYDRDRESEPRGVVYLHAVSVGEVGIAMKLLQAWLVREPWRRFVLATGTATGRAEAMRMAGAAVRVIYAPVDLPGLGGRCLERFSPQQVVLVEAEAWPNLLAAARRRAIPVRLINARLSPRSERRYRRFAWLVRPVFGMIERAGVQEARDVQRWAGLGIPRAGIEVTGSVKFDPGEALAPTRRAEFAAILDAFGAGRPVVLAASTHEGEEQWIAQAVRAVQPGALCVLVPRHAERRGQVRAALEGVGFEVILRSEGGVPHDPGRACLVIDTTGELRDWTAHASLVVIGKSILARGGQNPAEAVLAGVPFCCGPHMENFRPLIDRIEAAAGCRRIHTQQELGVVVAEILAGGMPARELAGRAREVLEEHRGATERTIRMLAGLGCGAT